MIQREIEVLDSQACWSKLHEQSVGRFVFSDKSGPAAIPVNYALDNEEIVFRISAASHLRDVLEAPVAFEVDDVHAQEGTGWSVLARGSAREIALEEVPTLVERLEQLPKPIAKGVHNVWVAVTPTQVTGRRLGAPFVGALF